MPFGSRGSWFKSQWMRKNFPFHFYLWNTGLITGLESPPPPRKKPKICSIGLETGCKPVFFNWDLMIAVYKLMTCSLRGIFPFRFVFWQIICQFVCPLKLLFYRFVLFHFMIQCFSHLMDKTQNGPSITRVFISL